jgi:hypothetical protein
MALSSARGNFDAKVARWLIFLAAWAGVGFKVVSGGCELPCCGGWDSNSAIFAASCEPLGVPSLDLGPGRRFSGTLSSPRPIRVRVSHRTVRATEGSRGGGAQDRHRAVSVFREGSAETVSGAWNPGRGSAGTPCHGSRGRGRNGGESVPDDGCSGRILYARSHTPRTPSAS